MKFLHPSILLLGLKSLTAANSVAAEASPEVSSWLAAQANIQTWSADFVQTRSLKTLTQPLKESGHVWFAAPNRFRWELGHPVKTMAVRAPQEMFLFYPRLKRVERYPLTEAAGPWREAMGLLEAGFPRSQAEMESRFNLKSQRINGAQCELVLQPKSAAARKMMPQIAITFDTKTHALLATELEFADGSKMRNDFSNPVLNPKLEDAMFAPEIPSDFKVIEPLKKKP
jgi:outer membrane lipoprotein-sorting protein